MLKNVLSLFLLFVLIIGASTAQEGLAQTDMTINPDNYRYAFSVVGMKVLNWEGDPIGTVKDLIIDPTAGFVSYILVKVKDAGETGLYPVPTIAATVEKGRYYIDIPKQRLLTLTPNFQELRGPFRYGSLTMQKTIFRLWSKTAYLLPGGYMSKEAASEWYGLGMRTFPGTMLLYSELKNRSVTAQKTGETIGTIIDIIIHPDTGDIFAAAVKSEAGLVTTGGNQTIVPLPPSVLTYDLEEKRMQYDLSPSAVATAPTLEGASQPGMQNGTEKWKDGSFREAVIDYWEEKNVTTALRSGFRIIPGMAAKVSELIDYTIVTLAGKEIGSIEDIVVTETGKTPYAMVRFHSQTVGDDVWHYVPFQALTLDRFNEQAIVGVEQKTVQQLSGFDEGTLPDTSDPDWDKEIRRFWERLLDRRVFEGYLEARDTGLQEEGPGSQQNEQADQTAFFAADLLSYPVFLTADKTQGTLEELVLNVE